jgi:hypothetical protein
MRWAAIVLCVLLTLSLTGAQGHALFQEPSQAQDPEETLGIDRLHLTLHNTLGLPGLTLRLGRDAVTLGPIGLLLDEDFYVFFALGEWGQPGVGLPVGQCQSHTHRGGSVMVNRIRRAFVCTLIVAGLMAGSIGPASPVPVQASFDAALPAPQAQSNLAPIKTYLTGKVAELRRQTTELKGVGDRYYTRARQAGFNYPAWWRSNRTQIITMINDARRAWMAASPLYEQMEGIVAGVPSLAEFDVILDAGAAQGEDGEVVPFDLTLPNGRVLRKPGNLFGVTESTLWGTFPAYAVPSVQADFNGNGRIDFGEALPEANVLKSATEALDRYTGELAVAAEKWQPTVSDAFTALVVMVPTMSEYFESWKHSRFVMGAASTQRDFVAISRLADIQDILGGLEVVYGGVEPLVRSIDSTAAGQVAQRLKALREFVASIHRQERAGKRYTPEEADILGAETQTRATAITGQISQAAARLNIKVQQ